MLLFQQTIKGSNREEAADRIDLVGQPNSADRSNIVAELGQEGQPAPSDRTAVAQMAASAQALSNLQAVYRIAEEAVSPSLSVDQLLKRILDLTIGVVGADRGCMLITDPQSGESVPKVISFGRRANQGTRMPVSRSIVDYVLKTGQGVRTSDARSDRRFAPGQSILQAGICEAMCVPMQGRYDVPGVIYVDTTTPAERVVLEGGATNKFSDDQLRLLVAIGSQAALAIENSRYQEALLKAERLAAMGQTIAMLSHHIKNILQGVRGGSFLIDLGLREHIEEHVRKGWAIVEKNQNKIYQLVMDMLAFSKERQPVMQAASLNQTVGEVCELMQARAAECKVRLEVRLNESLPTATFDAGRDPSRRAERGDQCHRRRRRDRNGSRDCRNRTRADLRPRFRFRHRQWAGHSARTSWRRSSTSSSRPKAPAERGWAWRSAKRSFASTAVISPLKRSRDLAAVSSSTGPGSTKNIGAATIPRRSEPSLDIGSSKAGLRRLG